MSREIPSGFRLRAATNGSAPIIAATAAIAVLALAGVLFAVRSPGTASAESVPGAASVGVPFGTPLTVTGSLVVTTPGTHLDALDVRGCITVLADNVWISRVRVSCSGVGAAISQVGGARGMLVEDSELVGDGSTGAGIWSDRDYWVRRSDIHGYHDGVFVGSGTVVEANWIHGLVQSAGDHNDLIQMVGGTGVRIIGNRLEHVRDQTSAVFLKSDLAPIDDVVVAGNVITGGAYSVYVMAGNVLGGCCGPPTNVAVYNNLFGAGSYLYGPLMVQGSNSVFCNMLDNGLGATSYDSDRGTNPQTNAPC